VCILTPVSDEEKHSYDMKEALKVIASSEEPLPLDGVVIKVADKNYRVSYAEHGAEMVQAKRIGYELDEYTMNETCVSPFHACIPRLEGAIKSMSERDLSTALHVFPQKLTRSVACPGMNIDGKHAPCMDGKVMTDDGERICSTCGGHGEVPVQTTAQEALVIPIGEDNEDRVPLEEMVKYITPDLEVVKYLAESIREVEEQCVKDVFNSNVFSIQAKKTATEVSVDYDAVYDTLQPFTAGYSRMYEFISTLVAEYTDTELESVHHRFPSDLKLKSFSDLIAEYSGSKDAPASVRESLERQMIHKEYIDNPTQKNKLLIQLNFDPLAGYSSEELASASIHIPDNDLFIHYNKKRIWHEVEKRNPEAYALEPSALEELFSATVAELNPAPVLPALEMGEGETMNSEQANKLRETVGGVTGIIEMNKAVAEGSMTESAAEQMLVQLFGFEIEVARALIDVNPPSPEG
jgi:hypothetical protein